jgi:hypothetical protein
MCGAGRGRVLSAMEALRSGDRVGHDIPDLLRKSARGRSADGLWKNGRQDIPYDARHDCHWTASGAVPLGGLGVITVTPRQVAMNPAAAWVSLDYALTNWGLDA